MKISLFTLVGFSRFPNVIFICHQYFCIAASRSLSTFSRQEGKHTDCTHSENTFCLTCVLTLPHLDYFSSKLRSFSPSPGKPFSQLKIHPGPIQVPVVFASSSFHSIRIMLWLQARYIRVQSSVSPSSGLPWICLVWYIILANTTVLPIDILPDVLLVILYTSQNESGEQLFDYWICNISSWPWLAFRSFKKSVTVIITTSNLIKCTCGD